MSASPEASASDNALKVLLDEYKELSSDIRTRVDLQHRNVNLLVVLMTAITGYLFNYWNDHGLQHGADALVRSEVAALIVVAPLFASVFVWRHLDHARTSSTRPPTSTPSSARAFPRVQEQPICSNGRDSSASNG